jgi:DNA-binding transcriptional ArsR family regulator
MVNHHERLDRVFAALVSQPRRTILSRLEQSEQASISELARPMKMKLPAIMKHLDVLEDAGLIARSKSGRSTMVRLSPAPMAQALEWLRRYERFWSPRLDRLAAYAEKKERAAAKENDE